MEPEDMPNDMDECIEMGLHNTEVDEDRSCVWCWN